MNRIIINKEKVKGTRGYKYLLICNTCKKEFYLGGNNFNKGRGLFCSKKCRANNIEERKKNSERIITQYKNGRKNPKGMLGKIPWNKNKENLKWKKEKNPNWNNGSSSEEYGIEFTKLLKNKIRLRDKNTCKECDKEIRNLVIHHIDYNKKNNNENNLITLCRSCHSKTNFKRNDWEKYFKNKL